MYFLNLTGGAIYLSRKLTDIILSLSDKACTKSLVEFEESMDENILNAWLSCGADEALLKPMEHPTFTPDMSVDEVINHALEIDDFLINLYGTIAEQSASDEVQQVFSNLLTLENNEKLQFVRNALTMKEV